MKQRERSASPKRKRTLLILIAIALVLASNPFAISAYVCASVSDRIVSLDEAATLDADAILVLGARVHDNGKPSGILKDRLVTGIAGPRAAIIVALAGFVLSLAAIATIRSAALPEAAPARARFPIH